ncbi:MAG: hypothetical protein GY711_13540 [bacterium]|nr:hypothetical protein [bacterium]
MSKAHRSEASDGDGKPAQARQKSIRFGEELLSQITLAARAAKTSEHRYIVDAVRDTVEGAGHTGTDGKLYKISHLVNRAPSYFLSPKPDFLITGANPAARIVLGIKTDGPAIKLMDFIDSEIADDDSREEQGKQRCWGPKTQAERMREEFRTTFLENDDPPRVFQSNFPFHHKILGDIEMNRVGLAVHAGFQIRGWVVTHNIRILDEAMYEVFKEMMDSHVAAITETTAL